MEEIAPDVLCLLFSALLDGRSFIWVRTTLPLVCKRWAALLRTPLPLYHHVTVNAKSECAHSRRIAALTRASVDVCGAASGSVGLVSPRSPPGGASPVLGSSPMGGSPPLFLRGGWPSGGSPPSIYQPLTRPHSAASVGCQSSSGGASSSSSSAAHAAHHRSLHHSASSSRVKARLSSRRVYAWLQPRAPAVVSLSLDLMGGHDFSNAALERLMYLLSPTLRRLHLAGGPVDASDCCEALGMLRGLCCLELTKAAPSVINSGLLQLAFLPSLHTLVLSLDIPPACPEQLRDLPTALRSVSLSNMWLQELPTQLADLSGLTSISLESCSLEADPLPLLLSLRALNNIGIKAPPRPLGHFPSFAGITSSTFSNHRGSSGGSSCAGGSRILSAALVECGLTRLPPALAFLQGLQSLDISNNPELGADVAGCLPDALADLPNLQALVLAHCGLGQVPPVVGELQWLTRLVLTGNPCTALPCRAMACSERIAVLDVAATHLKSLPAWILSATCLKELSLSAPCLAGPPPGGTSVTCSNSRGGCAVSAALGALRIGCGSGGPEDPLEGGGGHGSRWLRHLPQQLPGLRVLRIEGALWEQAAVKNVMALLSDTRGSGLLRLELLP